MATIRQLKALEVLDSRGRPTVRVTCGVSTDAHGTMTGSVDGTVSVPSGASTGAAEALELRDGDPARYRGLGCRKAVANVNGPIAEALVGRSFWHQSQLDKALLELDGTPNKSRLGANAVLGVSLAFARAAATVHGVPLYRHFADMLRPPLEGHRPNEQRLAQLQERAEHRFTLPRMTINLFSGGKHAGGQVPIQDVLVVPAAPTIDGGLAQAYAVYQAAADLTRRKYGLRALTADEGGLAPPFKDSAAMLADAVESIAAAGLRPGADAWLAVDLASSHFYFPDAVNAGKTGHYHLGDRPLDSDGMVGRLSQWVDRYPIVSIEDGLAEDDWDHWPKLRQALAGRALTLGDDFLCTNPGRIRRAIDAGAADALLLKVNQIGTLTEAAEALRLARSAGWRVTVSARSGETEDDWLADLAVGWEGDQIKVGSITQSERLAKYNRLLEIEADAGLPVVDWPTRR